MPVIALITIVLLLMFCLLLYLTKNSSITKEVQNWIADKDDDDTDSEVIQKATESINDLAQRKKTKKEEQNRLKKEEENISEVELNLSEKLNPKDLKEIDKEGK